MVSTIKFVLAFWSCDFVYILHIFVARYLYNSFKLADAVVNCIDYTSHVTLFLALAKLNRVIEISVLCQSAYAQ